MARSYSQTKRYEKHYDEYLKLIEKYKKEGLVSKPLSKEDFFKQYNMEYNRKPTNVVKRIANYAKIGGKRLVNRLKKIALKLGRTKSDIANIDAQGLLGIVVSQALIKEGIDEVTALNYAKAIEGMTLKDAWHYLSNIVDMKEKNEVAKIFYSRSSGGYFY